MARKRDIKQLRQAAGELKLTDEERYDASRELHAEKVSLGDREHMSYSQLLDWLREWKSAHGHD